VDVSKIASIALAMDMINQGFRSLAGLSNTLASVQASSDRIATEILDVPEEPIQDSGKTVLKSPRGDVEFRNVSFVYPDGTKALNNVSFTLPAGTSLALVGPSGAGKSTIADLLLRFYEPTSGEILIDGVDARELSIESVRAMIGVVPQATFLFAGTIEDNVRLGLESASLADLQEALTAAHAAEFVNEMHGRTTQELGERGIRLSGGQMQRVAIARALIRKPTILLLDEATSALDATSEKAVSEALVDIMKERTTLMIAHRLTTAARADRLMYLKAGSIVESGSHAELMAANGEYAALFRVFSSGIIGSQLG
jgi:subfamily B ATP-binding cassette protein MsbA